LGAGGLSIRGSDLIGGSAGGEAALDVVHTAGITVTQDGIRDRDAGEDVGVTAAVWVVLFGKFSVRSAYFSRRRLEIES
jgi:hypothetical protein